MTIGDVALVADPFGAHAPGRVDRAVIAITRRLPANWLGLRLAIGLRRIVTMRLGNGVLDADAWGMRVRFHPRDNQSEKVVLFTPQIYDRVERMELKKEIARVRRSGHPFVFVDVGANVGFYSLFVASQAGPQARIIAIEPDPTNFARLQFNLAENPGLPVHAVALEVDDRAGELVIIPNRRDRGGIRLRKPHTGQTGNDEIRVPCRPLTDILDAKGVNSIDALKIDVEGSEPAVLVPFFRHAPPTLWPRLILIEDTSQEWPVDLFALLAAKNYTVTARTRQNVILHLTRRP